uniref:VanZ family protein n=1 Tax=Heterorhabditis bacteriophora TaxID=37862 RepID=A0A1I7WV02_HETBA
MRNRLMFTNIFVVICTILSLVIYPEIDLSYLRFRIGGIHYFFFV